MGVLLQCEDLVTGAVLHSFLPAAMPVGQMGWEHRNATFTIANIAFGASPFGNYPAPFASRKWPWKVRVTGFMGYDAARDALASAIGIGVPVRLVYQTDAGLIRVCTGVAYKVTADFSIESQFWYDFDVEWELNSLWTERNPVNPVFRCGEIVGGSVIRCGEIIGGSVIRCGVNGTVAITGTTFVIPGSMVDSTLAGPGGIATQPDTGPIITINGGSTGGGGFGGTTGFQMLNNSDRYGCNFYFTLPIPPGFSLTIDCGAWKATSSVNGGTDVTNYLVVPGTQPYIFAITHNVVNSIVLAATGTGAVYAGSSVHIQWSRYFL